MSSTRGFRVTSVGCYAAALCFHEVLRAREPLAGMQQNEKSLKNRFLASLRFIIACLSRCTKYTSCSVNKKLHVVLYILFSVHAILLAVLAVYAACTSATGTREVAS